MARRVAATASRQRLAELETLVAENERLECALEALGALHERVAAYYYY